MRENLTPSGNRTILQVMDPQRPEELRQSVVASLEAVTQATERIYLKMGESYPEMIRQLDSFGKQEEGLTSIIRESLEVIASHQAVLAATREAGLALLGLLGEQMAALVLLRNHVGEIREDSVLMELISLNAMVVAAKAGESGRGFSVITSELKQLSNQTRDLTEQVSRRESGLGQTFSEFREELDRMNSQEQEQLSSFTLRIRGVFETLAAKARDLIDGLDSIQRRSDQVKVPLTSIMVEIQNQDRIRQSIDHVILSLREFQSHSDSASLDTRLDDLSYLEILPDLSVLVLEDVEEQISTSRDHFQGDLTKARALIDALETERSRFLFEQLESSSSGSLDHAFGQGRSCFDGFVADTKGLGRFREGSLRRRVLLLKNVEDLVTTLRSFDELLSKFRNIDLASRIQVARQSALSSMRDNAAETNALTGKIERDVSQATKLAADFSTTVQQLFESYRAQFSERLAEDGVFHQQLSETVKRLQDNKEALTRSIRGASLFTDEFTRRFQSTQADLDFLKELLDEIRKQKENLASIKNQIVDEKRQLMKVKGVKEWKLEKAKLSAIVDRFTIFTHKKLAASLGDFEIESSVASGEVTLF